MSELKKEFTFKGCTINIVNSSKTVSDGHCVRFLLKYVSHYLADEILPYDGFIGSPSEFKYNKILNFSVKDKNDIIEIYKNSKPHIEIKKRGFHDIQLLSEVNSYVHSLFFEYLHTKQMSVTEIMSQ